MLVLTQRKEGEEYACNIDGMDICICTREDGLCIFAVSNSSTILLGKYHTREKVKRAYESLLNVYGKEGTFIMPKED